jgi:hypothetical protein
MYICFQKPETCHLITYTNYFLTFQRFKIKFFHNNIVCQSKKAPPIKNSSILKIIVTIQWKKRPKPFPTELVLRQSFYFNLYRNIDYAFIVRVGQKWPSLYYLDDRPTSFFKRTSRNYRIIFRLKTFEKFLKILLKKAL